MYLLDKYSITNFLCFLIGERRVIPYGVLSNFCREKKKLLFYSHVPMAYVSVALEKQTDTLGQPCVRRGHCLFWAGML